MLIDLLLFASFAFKGSLTRDENEHREHEDNEHAPLEMRTASTRSTALSGVSQVIGIVLHA